MNRREIRYLCARLKSEQEGLSASPDLPEDFIEKFESQQRFRGWENYGVTWDVDEDDPWTIKFLSMSLEQQWHQELMNAVPELAYVEQD